MSTLHAHVSTSQRDCDGPTYSDHVISLNEEELREHVLADNTNDFHDIHFKQRVLGHIVAFHAEAEIHIFEEGFRYQEPTEEGFRASEVAWCEDADCDPNAESHRDVYAEMMNY